MASISFKSKKDNSGNYGLNSGLSYTPQYDYSQVAANPVSFKSQATPATQSGATADASKGGVIPDNTGNSGYGNTQFNPNQYVGNRVLSANNVSFGNNYNPNLAAGLKMDYNSSQPIYNLPQYYQQMGGYNAGLEAAKKKDADSGSGTHAYEKAYGITHQMPQAQTTDNSLSARMQRDLGDNSQLVNPNTSNNGWQWNPDLSALKKIMGFTTDEEAQNFMNNANLNWQAHQALVNAGVIVPTQASQDWTNYQTQMSQPSELPQYYDASGSGDASYVDGSNGSYASPEAEAHVISDIPGIDERQKQMGDGIDYGMTDKNQGVSQPYANNYWDPNDGNGDTYMNYAGVP